VSAWRNLALGVLLLLVVVVGALLVLVPLANASAERAPKSQRPSAPERGAIRQHARESNPAPVRPSLRASRSSHQHSTSATLQQRGDQTAAWMAQVLRAQVTPRTFEVGTVNPDAAGEATVDGVVRLDEAPAIDTAREVYIRTHELLHRPENQACWGWINDDGSLSPDRDTEEGIADALTRDLLPAALRRFAPSGWLISVEVGDYDRQVAGVRYAVRRLTGGRGWGYPERLMLRKLWAADCDTRRAMLEEAAR
jgi:hypothetical protein